MDPKTKRLKRLHRAFLLIVENAKAQGPIRGRRVADIMEPEPDFIDQIESHGELRTSDELVISLGAYLISAGYLVHTDTRSHTREREGLDYSTYEVTAKGTALLLEAAPVDPLVEDARIAK